MELVSYIDFSGQNHQEDGFLKIQVWDDIVTLFSISSSSSSKSSYSLIPLLLLILLLSFSFLSVLTCKTFRSEKNRNNHSQTSFRDARKWICLSRSWTVVAELNNREHFRLYILNPPVSLATTQGRITVIILR